MPNDDGGQRFASRLVVGVEAREIRTVEVQDAQKNAIPQQRDHELGPRRRIAGDMAWEGLHIRDQDASPFAPINR